MMSNHSTISCLILEDNHVARKQLQDHLQLRYPDITQFPCGTLMEADEVYLQQQPSLLVLDVNLPDGNCFEWLRKLSRMPKANFSVIIITAHAGYAIEALKFSAIDFLLKPYMPSDLLVAVDKALSNISDKRYHQQLEAFFYNHDQQTGEDKKLVLKTLDEIFIVPVSNILALEADNSYTQFRLKNGQVILVSQPIKEYENQLRGLGFMRVHQSHLINLKAIQTYKKKSNTLILDTEIEVPVSQQKKAQLMDYLNHL
jgi:two-component system LytT family response regulator